MTPELTYDSVSVSSFKRTPKRPTRPVPPPPQIPEESGGDSQLTDYSSWTPRDPRVSLYTIKSTSTWDPNQSIPSIPSIKDYSGDEEDDADDDLSFKTAQPPEPHVFQPAISKREAIEEAIRKIQRKAEVERISVIEEEQEDSSSEHTVEPPSFAPGKHSSVPALFRNASNPFALPFDDKSSRSSSEQPVSQSCNGDAARDLRTAIMSAETSPQGIPSSQTCPEQEYRLVFKVRQRSFEVIFRTTHPTS